MLVRLTNGVADRTYERPGFNRQLTTLLWRDFVVAVRDPTLYYLQVHQWLVVRPSSKLKRTRTTPFTCTWIRPVGSHRFFNIRNAYSETLKVISRVATTGGFFIWRIWNTEKRSLSFNFTFYIMRSNVWFVAFALGNTLSVLSRSCSIPPLPSVSKLPS